MREFMRDTPPSSVKGDDEISALDGDELIYIGDADEILDGDSDISSLDGMEDSQPDPPPDNAIQVFTQHRGSVFTCDIHPNGKIAVTGGEDDKAYVWDVETGNTIVECGNHKDSVIFASFSYDGAFLATVDMSGVIFVRKCTLDAAEENPWPVVFEFEAGDVTWGLWHFGARVLICGANSGEIYMFKIPSGEMKVLQGHSAKAECGKVLADGRRIAVGYDDGTVKIWDLKGVSLIHHIQPETKLDGIPAIDTHKDNNLIVTVSPDGKIMLMTASTGKIVGQMDGGIDLEAVAFTKNPELGYFAVGSLDGGVSVWDVSRQMKRHQCASPEDEDPSGVTKLLWHQHHLVTACLDGSVRVYDGRSGARTHVLTGHLSEVLDICYNAKTNIALTASEDKTARIFKITE